MKEGWQKTVCRLCPNGCGMLVKVENAVIKQIKGDPEDPRSEGLLCVKGETALSITYSKHRLTQPLVRVGNRGENKWQPLTWGQALKKTVNSIKQIRDQHGVDAISLYRGQASDWGAPWHYAKRFMSALGSPHICTPSHLCFIPSAIAKIATFGGVLSPDWDNTKCIIIWGANPTETNKDAVKGKKILDAVSRGAKLIVIDPFKTSLTKNADYWLQINPGTDCALALAMINVIISENLFDADFVYNWTEGFDELKQHVLDYAPENIGSIVGISPQAIREVARVYAANKPGIIYDGNGLEQRLNVVGNFQSICILQAIVGNIDIRGAGIFPNVVQTKSITLRDKLPKSIKPKGNYPLFYSINRETPPPAIVDAILNNEIKAMLVQGGNPIVTLANTRRTRLSFEKLDFIAVMDLFLTRTAQQADIVFPATTFLETTSLTLHPGLASNYLRLQQKVIDPIEQAWPDWKFWFELGKEMGFKDEFPWDSVEEAINDQLEPSGFTVERLQNDPVLFPFNAKKYKNNGFNTQSGKVELYSSLLKQYNYDPLPIYKESPVRVALNTGQSKHYTLLGTNWPRSSTYIHTALRNIPELRQIEPDPLVMINPSDANKRGINNNDLVTVSSVTGSIEVQACITNGTMPGVVGLTWGWGEELPEANMNDLIDDAIRDTISGGTLNREFLCEVRKAGYE